MGDPLPSIHELDYTISSLEDVLRRLPLSGPTRPFFLYRLGLGRLLRYESSHQHEDLHQSILHFARAILLPICPWDGPCVHTIQIFFSLTRALLQRSEESKQPDDLNRVIEYLQYIRGQPLEYLKISRSEAMTLLLEAISIRVKLEPSVAIQDIEEMIIICDQLLTSDTWSDVLTRACKALLNAITECVETSTSLLDRPIKSLRVAAMRRPHSPMFSIPLVIALVYRFFDWFMDSDFEEATAILKRNIVSWRCGDYPDVWSKVSPCLLAIFLALRSLVYEKPEYIEEALGQILSLQASYETGDPVISSRLFENLVQSRFRLFGASETGAPQGPHFLKPKDVSPSASWHSDAPGEAITKSDTLLVPHSTEAIELRIQHLHGFLSTAPAQNYEYRRSLDVLVELYETKFSLTGDTADLKEAIKYCRLLLASTTPGNVNSTFATISLAKLLEKAFDRTHKIEDINESIGLLRAALKSPIGQRSSDDVVLSLLSSLGKRFESSQDDQYTTEFKLIVLDEIPNILVNNKYASLPDRFTLSCFWAYNSRLLKFPWVSNDYEKAMSLLQDVVAFAPNLQIQHSQLVEMRDSIQSMPLDYASYQIETGHLEGAIVTLEQGRALLWSELRGFHSSTVQLSTVDPLLVEKFTVINQELENLTISALPNGRTHVSGAGESKGSSGEDPFNRLLLTQRKLLEERRKLISHIRTIPGLQGFLLTPSFDALRSAASHGPVIIINHSKFRSDILILLHHSPPSLIPTPEGFYDHANRLKDELQDSRRKSSLDSNDYESALASVLMELYTLVGQPVINRLQELNIPEQSRVWWCPTSAFCSLPLHAMGPIPSNDGEQRYFCDLYIPSYTPTLSALIESCKPDMRRSKQPSLLLVARPDQLPGVKGEICIIQKLDIEVECLINRKATAEAVVGGLKYHEFVHFACHGNLEHGKPFDASFELYGDKQLKLLDIIRSRLPTAEFAFLSACHTAELTKESVDDEGLHLTAAVQYCGFRSVVGTIWAMADIDGQQVARHFYRSMLSGSDEVRCYERSAKALRDALKELRTRRRNRFSLERWVNFVHYGA